MRKMSKKTNKNETDCSDFTVIRYVMIETRRPASHVRFSPRSENRFEYIEESGGRIMLFFVVLFSPDIRVLLHDKQHGNEPRLSGRSYQ